MYLDEQAQLSDSQALTNGAALSTNVIDLGSVDRNIGTGEPLCIVFNVEVAALVSDNDETYQFDVEVASDAAMTTARILQGRRIFDAAVTLPAEDADNLAAGFIFAINLPPGQLTEAERYLAVRYTLGGTTAGVTVSAHLIPLKGVQMSLDYPKGYTIS